MKKVTFLVLAAGAILAIPGCASHHAIPAAAPAPSTTAPVGASPTVQTSVNAPPAVPATGSTMSPATGQPAVPKATAGKRAAAAAGATATPGATAATGGTAAAGCPVTTETLTAALTASGERRFALIPSYATLTNPECYQNFAVAQSQPKNEGQTGQVLFGFDATTQAWHPLNVGSADYCQGFVPQTIAAHFTGC